MPSFENVPRGVSPFRNHACIADHSARRYASSAAVPRLWSRRPRGGKSSRGGASSSSHPSPPPILGRPMAMIARLRRGLRGRYLFPSADFCPRPCDSIVACPRRHPIRPSLLEAICADLSHWSLWKPDELRRGDDPGRPRPEGRGRWLFPAGAHNCSGM